MNDNIYYQLYVFVLCCIFGVILAILFDIFRIKRRIVHTSVFLTFIEDMLFWVLASLLFFILILRFYNGEFRVFMVVGIVIGAMAYFGTLSKLFVSVCVVIVRFLTKFFKNIICIVLLPLKFILKLFNKPLIFAVSVSRRSWYGIRSKFIFKFNIINKFVFRRNIDEKK